MFLSKHTTKITKILHQKFGFPPVIAAGWLYSTPVFLLLYLLSCYDDFSAVAREFANYKKAFGVG